MESESDSPVETSDGDERTVSDTEEDTDTRRTSYAFENLHLKSKLFLRITGFRVIEFEKIVYPLVAGAIDILFQSRRGPSRKLSKKSHAVLVLFYLRRGLPFFDIAPHFNLTEASTRRIIHSLVPPICGRLDQLLIKWVDWRNQSMHIDEEAEPLLWRVVGIVDATELEVGRPRSNDEQRQFYSGKKKKHTVKFQVVVRPVGGRIMHVFGPEPGSIHDIRVFDRSGVADMMHRREVILADSGYQGLESRNVNCVIPRKKPRNSERSEEDSAYNTMISRHRVLVENVIGLVKEWKIVGRRWRGKLHQHSFLRSVFRLCCIFTNIKIKLHEMPLLIEGDQEESEHESDENESDEQDE